MGADGGLQGSDSPWMGAGAAARLPRGAAPLPAVPLVPLAFLLSLLPAGGRGVATWANAWLLMVAASKSALGPSSPYTSHKKVHHQIC